MTTLLAPWEQLPPGALILAVVLIVIAAKYLGGRR